MQTRRYQISHEDAIRIMTKAGVTDYFIPTFGNNSTFMTPVLYWSNAPLYSCAVVGFANYVGIIIYIYWSTKTSFQHFGISEWYTNA